MAYDVTLVPAKTFVIQHFPELQEHPEYADPRNDQLLRIGFLAHDEKSPFVKLEKEDYIRRLTKIFEFLKINDIKLIESLSLGKNKPYEAIVNRIFMQSDNLAYIMWSNKMKMFHFIGLALRKAPDLDDLVEDMRKRAALDKQLKDIYNDLVEYESQIFEDIPTRKKIRKQFAKLLQPAESHAVEKQVI